MSAPLIPVIGESRLTFNESTMSESHRFCNLAICPTGADGVQLLQGTAFSIASRKFSRHIFLRFVVNSASEKLICSTSISHLLGQG